MLNDYLAAASHRAVPRRLVSQVTTHETCPNRLAHPQAALVMATRKPTTNARTARTPTTRGKSGARSSQAGGGGAATSAKSTASGPSRPGRPSKSAPADPQLAKMQGTQALAAGMPYNPNQAAEHGDLSAIPPQGSVVEPATPDVTGSTLSEKNASDKAGTTAKPGFNPGNLSLDHVR